MSRQIQVIHHYVASSESENSSSNKSKKNEKSEKSEKNEKNEKNEKSGSSKVQSTTTEKKSGCGCKSCTNKSKTTKDKKSNQSNSYKIKNIMNIIKRKFVSIVIVFLFLKVFLSHRKWRARLQRRESLVVVRFVQRAALGINKLASQIKSLRHVARVHVQVN